MPRPTYDRLIPVLKNALPARQLGELARDVGFVRRLRAIRAGTFVWAVVLSRLASGIPGFAEARHWYERLGGRKLWPRPFQMRFKSAAAVLMMERAFERVVAPWRDCKERRSSHPLARQFTDIVLWDSTMMQVHDELRPVFKGIRTALASLKAGLAISAFGGVPLYAKLTASNDHDMRLFPPLELWAAGTLFLFDKGFVAHGRLGELTTAGLYFLCPMRRNGNGRIVKVHSAPSRVRKRVRASTDGVMLRDVLPAKKRLGRIWDLEVALRTDDNANSKTPVTVRLVITPGPDRCQRPYYTNLLPKSWPPKALRELYRLRWQVELAFKELKQHVNLEALPSRDPHAVQVFAWASLLALALSRLVCGWLLPLAKTTGLRSPLRPALLTRALRSSVSLLAAVLIAPSGVALLYLRILALDLRRAAKVADVGRADSFSRLKELMPSAA